MSGQTASMDDLGERISQLLSSPDAMDKIGAAMAALGGSLPGETATTPPVPDGGRLPDLTALTKLAPLMGSLNKDTDDTRLLQALRPYLHGEREQRLDEAVRLLRMLQLLPLLQNSGLGSLLTGGDIHGQ